MIHMMCKIPKGKVGMISDDSFEVNNREVGKVKEIGAMIYSFIRSQITRYLAMIFGSGVEVEVNKGNDLSLNFSIQFLVLGSGELDYDR